MNGPFFRCLGAAVLLGMAPAAMSHGCDPLDKYLIGHYHGDCDDQTELAQGQGEAKGADTYRGAWIQGKPEGKGVYTWEKGARLEGMFKGGKAHGPGVFTSTSGARYPGPFVDGKLRATDPSHCPVTPGPLTC